MPATDLDSLFDRLAAVPRTEGVSAAEESWAGGVADFGDRRAALLVQGMPGYFDYRGAVEDVLRDALGDAITVYRVMPEAQLDEWATGADMDPLAVSLDRDVAEGFRNFAGHAGRDDLALVEFEIGPQDVVMVGKAEEAELVVDAIAVSFHLVRRLDGGPRP